MFASLIHLGFFHDFFSSYWPACRLRKNVCSSNNNSAWANVISSKKQRLIVTLYTNLSVGCGFNYWYPKGNNSEQEHACINALFDRFLVKLYKYIYFSIKLSNNQRLKGEITYLIITILKIIKLCINLQSCKLI